MESTLLPTGESQTTATEAASTASRKREQRNEHDNCHDQGEQQKGPGEGLPRVMPNNVNDICAVVEKLQPSKACLPHTACTPALNCECVVVWPAPWAWVALG